MKTFVCHYCGTVFTAQRSRKYCTPEHKALAFCNCYTVINDQAVSLRAPIGGWENCGVYDYGTDGSQIIRVTHLYPNTGVEIISKRRLSRRVRPR